MSDERLDPAHTVIQSLGGFEAVAGITGKHISSIYRWTYPKSRGGTDGFIPPADATLLLKHARDNDLPVTAESFFPEQAA
jgi:hypothetical protein